MLNLRGKRLVAIFCFFTIVGLLVSTNVAIAGIFSKKQESDIRGKILKLQVLVSNLVQKCSPAAKATGEILLKCIKGAAISSSIMAGIVLTIIILWKLFLKRMLNDMVDSGIGKINGAIAQNLREANNTIASIVADFSTKITEQRTGIEQNVRTVLSEVNSKITEQRTGLVQNISTVKTEVIGDANVFLEQNLNKVNEKITEQRTGLTNNVKELLIDVNGKITVQRDELEKNITKVLENVNSTVNDTISSLPGAILNKNIKMPAKSVFGTFRNIGNKYVFHPIKNAYEEMIKNKEGKEFKELEKTYEFKFENDKKNENNGPEKITEEKKDTEKKDEDGTVYE